MHEAVAAHSQYLHQNGISEESTLGERWIDAPVGREDESVDDISSLERVEVLALVQVPEHGDSILSTGSAEGTIWGDGDGRDVASVSPVCRAQLALAQFPDLFGLAAKHVSYAVSQEARSVVRRGEARRVRDLGGIEAFS